MTYNITLSVTIRGVAHDIRQSSISHSGQLSKGEMKEKAEEWFWEYYDGPKCHEIDPPTAKIVFSSAMPKITCIFTRRRGVRSFHAESWTLNATVTDPSSQVTTLPQGSKKAAARQARRAERNNR